MAFARLLRLEAFFAGTFLVLMAVLIFVGGIARLVREPQNWTIDLATCFFAWAAFLSADVAWRRNALMSVNLVAGRLSERSQRVLLCANYLIICAFLVYVIVAGVNLAYVSWERSFQGIPWVSYSWVTLSLPVGGALLLLTTLQKLRDTLRMGPLTRGDLPGA